MNSDEIIDQYMQASMDSDLRHIPLSDIERAFQNSNKMMDDYLLEQEEQENTVLNVEEPPLDPSIENYLKEHEHDLDQSSLPEESDYEQEEEEDHIKKNTAREMYLPGLMDQLSTGRTMGMREALDVGSPYRITTADAGSSKKPIIVPGTSAHSKLKETKTSFDKLYGLEKEIIEKTKQLSQGSQGMGASQRSVKPKELESPSKSREKSKDHTPETSGKVLPAEIEDYQDWLRIYGKNYEPQSAPIHYLGKLMISTTKEMTKKVKMTTILSSFSDAYPDVISYVLENNYLYSTQSLFKLVNFLASGKFGEQELILFQEGYELGVKEKSLEGINELGKNMLTSAMDLAAAYDNIQGELRSIREVADNLTRYVKSISSFQHQLESKINLLEMNLVSKNFQPSEAISTPDYAVQYELPKGDVKESRKTEPSMDLQRTSTSKRDHPGSSSTETGTDLDQKTHSTSYESSKVNREDSLESKELSSSKETSPEQFSNWSVSHSSEAFDDLPVKKLAKLYDDENESETYEGLIDKSKLITIKVLRWGSLLLPMKSDKRSLHFKMINGLQSPGSLFILTDQLFKLPKNVTEYIKHCDLLDLYKCWKSLGEPELTVHVMKNIKSKVLAGNVPLQSITTMQVPE
uniref:Uncharacterized protein n=1 Tax=Clastoptera arizonana TaxID=38151 RepID=A0A1B6D3I7_9HEMI